MRSPAPSGKSCYRPPHGFCPVDDAAAIDVYVLLLPLPKRRVGRELEGGSRHEAECGAPTRRETDQVGPASDLAGHGDRVVARSAHEHEALGGTGSAYS